MSNKYFDTKHQIIVTAYKAEEYTGFFNAIFGPHGAAEAGQWVASDASGLSIAFDEEDFNKRFIQIKMQRLAWKSAGETDFPEVLGCDCPRPPTKGFDDGIQEETTPPSGT
jgi:hypothetical protein